MVNFLKGFLIGLLILIVLTGLFIGFLCLCKWQNWLPEFVEPVREFFNDCGITFLNNIHK